MTLAILTTKSYKKENYKDRLKQIIKEKIKNYQPTKILINEWDSGDYLEKDSKLKEVVTNKSLNECELIMIIRCATIKCKELEDVVKDLDNDKLTVKNYKI